MQKRLGEYIQAILRFMLIIKKLAPRGKMGGRGHGPNSKNLFIFEEALAEGAKAAEEMFK